MNAIENLGKTGVLWLMTKVKNALTGKVDKENGKGLSTNDFTDEYKTAVDTNESNISTLQTTVDTKVTADDVTAQVEAYGYQTAENVETAITAKGYQTADDVQSTVNSALEGITGISIEVVNSLPASGTKGVIYLMAHSHGEGDSYDEYVWVENNSSYEKIGNTDVDLSAYVKASDISIISESELEAMWNT